MVQDRQHHLIYLSFNYRYASGMCPQPTFILTFYMRKTQQNCIVIFADDTMVFGTIQNNSASNIYMIRQRKSLVTKATGAMAWVHCFLRGETVPRQTNKTHRTHKYVYRQFLPWGGPVLKSMTLHQALYWLPPALYDHLLHHLGYFIMHKLCHVNCEGFGTLSMGFQSTVSSCWVKCV